MGVDQFGNPIRPIIHTEWSLQYVWDTGTLAWVPMTQTGGGGGGGTVDQGTGGVSPWLVTGPLTDAQLRAAAVPVSGTFFQGTQPVSGPLTDAQLRAVAVPVSVATVPTHTVDQGLKNAGGAAGWPVQDAYNSGEVLADQTGAGAVLTFTFSNAMKLIVVHANGLAVTDIARADPFGGTPSATLGIPCGDEIPTYIPVEATVVRVFAQTGNVVSVWGFRYV